MKRLAPSNLTPREKTIWLRGFDEGYMQACKDVKTEQMPLFESRETVRAKYGCSENPCREHG